MLMAVDEQPDLFSYAALSREGEASAREDAALIRSNASDIAKKGIEMGEALNRQKKQMGHGLFMAWVRDECRLSDRTAQVLMKAARDVAANPQMNAHLEASRISIGAIDLLFASGTATNIRDQVEALLVDGQKVTVADIRRMKAETKAAQNGRELAALDAEAAEKKAADLEASQSEEAAKIAKRVGAGFEDELRRLRRENEELRKAAARAAPTTADTNVVAFHKPLTEAEEEAIDAEFDNMQGADFNAVASPKERALAFFAAVRAIATVKAAPSDVYHYIRNRKSKSIVSEYMGMISEAISQLQAVKDKHNG